MLVELDLTVPLGEITPTDPLSQLLGRKRANIGDVLTGLDLAARSANVVGLVAKVGVPKGIGLAQIQEIRSAVKAFGTAGKPTLAWAETFGELTPGLAGYYLASGFGEIWLQPSGDVVLAGTMAKGVFVREALEKLGVEAQLGRRKEYKSAADMFTETGFTDPNREATSALVAGVTSEIVQGIAEARRLATERVDALVDQGVLSAPEALEAGLIDRIGYGDQCIAELRERCGPGEVPLRYVHRFRQHAERSKAAGSAARRVLRRPRPAVAVVSGHGTIRVGRSTRGPMGAAMGADSLRSAFRAATADPAVKAVVLRVDSRGGSYVASDAIWRAARLVEESGRPLVVSMGNVAASGGYFVSLAAPLIMAQPSTITGSIGVFGGKVVTGTALERVGIRQDAISQGRHAQMFSSHTPYGPQDWELLQGWLDRVYEDFVGRVATARKMTIDSAHEVAKGRVWTGRDAKDRGLVDALGGLGDAIERAADRAGLARDSYDVHHFPKANPWDQLRPPESSESAGAALGSLDLSLVSGLQGLVPTEAARISRGVLLAPEVHLLV